MKWNRRDFLKSSAAAGIALSSQPLWGATSASSKYRTAIIGSGWWGMNILGEAMASDACQIVGMSDVDQRVLNPAAERVRRLSNNQPKLYRDYREMLDREKPEICIVASPDHWHPLQTIDAVKAGAHVYVEKPISHTIREGRAMVNAARATGRVVQVGTHRRISPHNVSGREFIRSGKLGKVGMVRAFVLYGGGPETAVQNKEAPKEIDWNLWCGPAPMRHYCDNFPGMWGNAIHPRGFRNYLDYANGTLGDWGIHWMDQILWILDAKYPRTVYSTGGRNIAGPPVYTEKEQTTDAPDHQVASFAFDDFTAVWEHRRFGGNDAEKGENVGCYFYGTQGTLHMAWKSGWTFYPSNRNGTPIQEEPQLNEPDQQNIKGLWTDLLKCIKTGDKPVCDIEEIYYSTNMSLLGMLSYKLGRSVAWDGQDEVILNDLEANHLLSRKYRKGWEYPKA